MDQGQGMEQGKVCGCGHHKVMPILVILFALVFLMHALHIVGMGLVNVTWPILLIIAACAKMGGRSCGCCKRGVCMNKGM